MIVIRRTALRRATAVAVAAVAAFAVSIGPAAADSVPFTDPAAAGPVTLCDVNGKVLTHGDIRTKPFAWRAVGGQRPDGSYAGAGRTATLFGFQPIDGVTPGRWVGDYLTGSAVYSSTTSPMAAATAVDRSLADYLDDYPAKWDGLVQLRLFLGAPGAATLTSAYSAATVKVDGTSWTLVSGGRSGCDSGTARSSELILPSVAALGTPAANATTTVVQPSGGASSGSARAGGAASSTPAPASGSDSPTAPSPSGADSASPVAATSDSGSGGSALVWVLVVVAVLLVAGVAYAFRHRLAALRGR